jgi:UMF1 family MFS transporter
VKSQARASKKGIWGWMLFDFAQQPFHTLIITFVFAPYFAAHVAQNPAQGQEYWGYAAGIGGAIIALTSPVLGAIADATGPRKPWICCSRSSASSAAGCYGTPCRAQPR